MCHLHKAATPLLRPLRDAAYVHGESGMEGDFVDHQRQPLAKSRLSLSDVLMNAPVSATLVAIGPLTNIVLLLRCTIRSVRVTFAVWC